MKIQVKSDVYFITDRLKEIDSSYFVVYNNSSKKFELHSSDQLFTTYCLTFPYDTLDERAVLYARKSRSENREKLLREMEMQNEKLLKSIQKNSQDMAMANLE